MRILRLYIGEYRVLSQLDMRFDPGQPQEVKGRNYHLDFLVGVNGTGKSTALRLLGRIFKGVQKSFDELSDLPFILEYYLESQNKKVRISNIHPDELTPLERYFVTTAPNLIEAYETDEPDEQYLIDNVPVDLLPERIIAYTTGNEMEWLADSRIDNFDNNSLEPIKDLSIHERALKELPGWLNENDLIQQQKRAEDVRFRFILQNQLVLVALAGLLQHCMCVENESPLQAVLKETDINKLAGFALQFKLPYASDVERRNLWQQIGQYATRAIRSGSEYRLIYDLTNPDLASKLLESTGGALPFFESLAGWYSGENPILTKVTLLIERTPIQPQKEGEAEIIPPLHTWDWLSDGERSFIGRMCLFSLFGEVESLILLDEPEVHFNDYWKRHIVSTMHQVFKMKNGSAICHVLVATHSSISLSDVHREDVILLIRNSLRTSGNSYIPAIQTFGADPSDIMVHVFGTGFANGELSTNYIRERIAKSTKEELEKLQTEVAPGYWHYRIQLEINQFGEVQVL